MTLVDQRRDHRPLSPRSPMPSIKDVAARAGVGLGTVSRVLNGSGYVSAATRDKVDAAIEELGYVPNEIGRSFRTQRSNSVGLIVPSIRHPLFADLAFSIERELDRLGYRLTIGNSDFDLDKELEFVGLLERNVIDGVIFVSNSDLEPALVEPLPIVTIDRHLGGEFACVTSDNVGGGALAAEHLIGAGCRHVAYVGGFPGVDSEVFGRRSGFVDTVEGRDGVELTVFDEGSTIDDEQAFARRFAEEHPDVDGVFCITDLLALAVIDAVVERGRSVPDDVQVVGYDGILAGSPFGPGLTTVRQPIGEMGRTAVEELLAGLDGSERGRRIELPVELLQGRTTRPVAE